MKKVLVAYFSAGGATAALAHRLADAVGADTFEIRPAVPYTAADLDWTNPDSRFAGVDAVINNRVYQIPVGVTRYGHPNSIEIPLAIYWLAKVLYPELFDYTIEEKIKEFYLQFFGYEVDDELAAEIIQGDGIRTDKNK